MSYLTNDEIPFCTHLLQLMATDQSQSFVMLVNSWFFLASRKTRSVSMANPELAKFGEERKRLFKKNPRIQWVGWEIVWKSFCEFCDFFCGLFLAENPVVSFDFRQKIINFHSIAPVCVSPPQLEANAQRAWCGIEKTSILIKESCFDLPLRPVGGSKPQVHCTLYGVIDHINLEPGESETAKRKIFTKVEEKTKIFRSSSSSSFFILMDHV